MTLAAASEDLPRIFDRFFTCNTSRTRASVVNGEKHDDDHLHQSSGLGLAIASKIIAGHDSVLRVESEVDQGSTFWFELDHVSNTDQELEGKS